MLIKTVRSAIKNWWVHLLLGILLIIMGAWVMTTPISSYITLSIFFSVLMFISGLTELIFAISNAKNIDGWGDGTLLLPSSILLSVLFSLAILVLL